MSADLTYPIIADRRIFALANVDRLDIRTWHGTLVGVSSFLGGAAGMVSSYQEIKDDLEREMRRDYEV